MRNKYSHYYKLILVGVPVALLVVAAILFLSRKLSEDTSLATPKATNKSMTQSAEVQIEEPQPNTSIFDPDLSENVSFPFMQEKVFTDVYQKTSIRPNFEDPADVDADGIAEEIVWVPTAMNHGAGEIWIVKEGQVIFQSTDRTGRFFEPSLDGNGFYLGEGMRGDNGEWNTFMRITKYDFEDGRFVPKYYYDEDAI